MFEKINKNLQLIKRDNPLILNLTNPVTMELVANGLLSLGASPVMSEAEQEIEDLLQLAGALVINMGTLNEAFINLCQHACRIANTLKKPIILDPVGVGASHYRTATCQALVNTFDIAIIRGNASEIMGLTSAQTATTKGVDSQMDAHVAIESARIFSRKFAVAIVISGKEDVVIDGDQLARFDRGSALMPKVTGTGCLLSAVIAAFLAVNKDRFNAASAATVFYGLCGEIAEKQASHPGSFKVKFLDSLSILPDRDQYDKK